MAEEPHRIREQAVQAADTARRGRLERVGVDLMNAYNQGRTNPAWMAVNGHDTITGYEFLIGHPSGEDVLVTVTPDRSVQLWSRASPR